MALSGGGGRAPPQTAKGVTAAAEPLPKAHPAPGKGDRSGRSPGLRVRADASPSRPGERCPVASGMWRRRSPLTVAGAAPDLHRVPFCSGRFSTRTGTWQSLAPPARPCNRQKAAAPPRRPRPPVPRPPTTGPQGPHDRPLRRAAPLRAAPSALPPAGCRPVRCVALRAAAPVARHLGRSAACAGCRGTARPALPPPSQTLRAAPASCLPGDPGAGPFLRLPGSAPSPEPASRAGTRRWPAVRCGWAMSFRRRSSPPGPALARGGTRRCRPFAASGRHGPRATG